MKIIPKYKFIIDKSVKDNRHRLGYTVYAHYNKIPYQIKLVEKNMGFKQDYWSYTFGKTNSWYRYDLFPHQTIAKETPIDERIKIVLEFIENELYKRSWHENIT